MSADMSPYCSAHDEWLIMKLCMYVGYHNDANNVSNFGGDPIKKKKVLQFFYTILLARRTIAMTRSQFLRLLLRDARRLLEYGRPTPTSNDVKGKTLLNLLLSLEQKLRHRQMSGPTLLPLLLSNWNPSSPAC